MTSARDPMTDAFLDLLAGMTAAASAYREHARRHKDIRPRATADALFTTRAADFDATVQRAHDFIKGRLG